FNRAIVPMLSVFTFCLFATLWLSLLFGYVTLINDISGEWGFLGGGVGDAMAEVFQSMFGWGTFLFLMLSLFIFIIFFFNVTALNVLRPANPRPIGNDAIVDGEDNGLLSGYTDEGDNWPEIVERCAKKRLPNRRKLYLKKNPRRCRRKWNPNPSPIRLRPSILKWTRMCLPGSLRLQRIRYSPWKNGRKRISWRNNWLKRKDFMILRSISAATNSLLWNCCVSMRQAKYRLPRTNLTKTKTA